jgi:hypothetical protein
MSPFHMKISFCYFIRDLACYLPLLVNERNELNSVKSKNPIAEMLNVVTNISVDSPTFICAKRSFGDINKDLNDRPGEICPRNQLILRYLKLMNVSISLNAISKVAGMTNEML